MSEERKDEILGREGELDEGELEAVAGAKGASCGCVIVGVAASKGKEPCFVVGEGKPPCLVAGEGKPNPPCACVVTGNGGDWKP